MRIKIAHWSAVFVAAALLAAPLRAHAQSSTPTSQQVKPDSNTMGTDSASHKAHWHNKSSATTTSQQIRPDSNTMGTDSAAHNHKKWHHKKGSAMDSSGTAKNQSQPGMQMNKTDSTKMSP